MYIQSTKPGNTWHIHVNRGSKGLYCCAIEGVKENDCFSYMMFEARQEHTMLVSKRLTAKVESEAIEAMKQSLIAKGFAQ